MWLFQGVRLVCACTSRSHELSNADTIADWETDFKWSAAAAVLKRVILEGGCKSVEPETAEVALGVCKARLSHIRDMIEAGWVASSNQSRPVTGEKAPRFQAVQTR